MYEGYDKLIQRLDNYRRDLPQRLQTDVLEDAALQMQKAIRNRIFKNGIDTKGDEISNSYGTSPITVQKKSFIKPSAFKGEKSMKLKYGYKELREIQGLETDKVNLRYSGDLRESFKIIKRNVSIIIGFNTKDNFNKAKSLEKKYDKTIFKPSKEERKANLKKIVAGLRKIHKAYFYG